MKIVPEVIEQAWEKIRFDGWVNTITGLGGINDKRMAGLMKRGRILSDAECSDMYHFDDLARLICELLPETAMAAGFELLVPGKEEVETAICGRLQEMHAWQRLCEAAIWGRCFGGGGLLLGANDGRDVATPLEVEAVKSVDYLVPVDKRSLWIKTWYEDPRSPKFGQPETYRLQRQTPAQFMEQQNGGGQTYGAVIHESRIIVFGGARTADIEKTANRGWDYSCLQAPFDVLRDFGVGWGGASLLLQEASQAVYGVENLAQTLASAQGEERLRRRFRMIEMGRSIARAMVIDTKETFERKPTSFTGVPDMLDRFCNRLAAATRIPVTVLMGTAPAGLNATGESDIRTWNSACTNWRKNELEPAMEQLVKLFLVEAGQGIEPDSWSVKYPPIYQDTPTEQALLRKTVAETDAIEIQWGITLPDEVAKSRHAAEGWSAETSIDLDLREKLEKSHAEEAEAAAAQAAETAKNPPEPVQVGPDGKPVPTAAGNVGTKTGGAKKPPSGKPSDG